MKNVNCYSCSKQCLDKNEIGLNKKLLGRKIKIFFCLNCLAKELEITSEELIIKIEEFKAQGCTLFI
jgi:uncharacterized protein YlaI